MYSDATKFLFMCLAIVFAIQLYNLYVVFRISKAVRWILTHVHVVPQKQQDRDPDLIEIKRTFGVEDDTPDMERKE